MTVASATKRIILNQCPIITLFDITSTQRKTAYVDISQLYVFGLILEYTNILENTEGGLVV